MLLLDGGLASTLQNDGYSVDGDALWSARMIHTCPSAVSSVHKRFLEAGCDIITTASYQASVPGFSEHLGIDCQQARDLISLSVSLAKQCVRQSNRPDVSVAASIGPYGACLADGSEYTGSYLANLSSCQLKEWHRPRVELVVAAGADMLAVETIPGVKEALAILELVREHPDLRLWISFSCKDAIHTSDGRPFSQAVRTLMECICDGVRLEAVGVNCLHPSLVTPLLGSIDTNRLRVPLIAYPNNGDLWNGFSWERSGCTPSLHQWLNEYVSAGLKIMGGCCRLSPDHIKQLRSAMHRLSLHY